MDVERREDVFQRGSCPRTVPNMQSPSIDNSGCWPISAEMKDTMDPAKLLRLLRPANLVGRGSACTQLPFAQRISVVEEQGVQGLSPAQSLIDIVDSGERHREGQKKFGRKGGRHVVTGVCANIMKDAQYSSTLQGESRNHVPLIRQCNSYIRTYLLKRDPALHGHGREWTRPVEQTDHE